jgi:hypothetical protein
MKVKGFSIEVHLFSSLSYTNGIAAKARSCKELQQFLNSVVKHSADVGSSFCHQLKNSKIYMNTNKNLQLNIIYHIIVMKSQ